MFLIIFALEIVEIVKAIAAERVNINAIVVSLIPTWREKILSFPCSVTKQSVVFYSTTKQATLRKF